MLAKRGEIGTLVHGWWECKFIKSLFKTVWWFLKNLNTELSYDLAIPLLGISPNNWKKGLKEIFAHPCS